MPLALLFTGFYTWLIGLVGARTALVIFAAGTVITCTAALLAIIQSSIAALASAMAGAASGLPVSFLMAFWSIIPANLGTVIATIFATDAAVFACKYHLNLVAIMTK